MGAPRTGLRVSLRSAMAAVVAVSLPFWLYAQNVLGPERRFRRDWALYRAAMAERSKAQAEWHLHLARERRGRAATLARLAATDPFAQVNPGYALTLSVESASMAREAALQLREARRSKQDARFWSRGR